MSVKEIITELDKIVQLNNRVCDVNMRIDKVFSLQDEELSKATDESEEKLRNYQKEQEKSLSNYINDLWVGYYEKSPFRSCLYEVYTRPKAKHPHITILFGIAQKLIIFFFLIFIIYGIIVDSAIVGFLSIPLFILGIAVYNNDAFDIATEYLRWYEVEHEQQKENKEWEAAVDKSFGAEANEKRYNAFRAYEEKFFSCLEACDKEYEKESKIQKEISEKIEAKYESDISVLNAEKNKYIEELNTIDIIPEELLDDAENISKMLKQKRADTLKEAINLVFEEKQREAEELQRRLEAQNLERKVREHNEAMERAAREEALAMKEHNKAMERAAQAQAEAIIEQARAAQAQQRAQREAEETQERAARARCASCANRFICSADRQRAYSCNDYRRS